MSAVILGAGTSLSGGGQVEALALIRSLRLESSAGSVVLTESPYDVVTESAGLTGAPFDVDTAMSPSYDGEVLRSDRMIVDRLEVLLPILIRSSTARQVADAAQVLRAITGHKVTDCRLVATLDDGSTRSLAVRRYQLASDEWRPITWVHGWRVVPLRLRALDPWWSGDERSRTWAVGGAGGSFFPILPLSLSESAVLGEANPLEVGGDLDSWPTWTITGPFTSLTITRGDGLTWTVDEPLASGETLTVVTDPRATGRVSHSVDGNWWQYVAPGSELFRLRTEGESVLVEAVGADEDTTVTVAWSPRFEVLL